MEVNARSNPGPDGCEDSSSTVGHGEEEEEEDSYWFCGLCNQEFDDRNELLSHIMSCQGPSSSARGKPPKLGLQASDTQNGSRLLSSANKTNDGNSGVQQANHKVEHQHSGRDTELQVSFGSDSNEHEAVDVEVTGTETLVSKKKVVADENALFVYHCWLCGDEYLDKVGLIRHLKCGHSDVPELRGLESKMSVPVCLKCGANKGAGCLCPQRDGDAQSSEDDDDLASPNEPSERKTVPCTICGFSVRGASQLRLHRLNKHPGEKSHQCTSCPACFSTRSQLRSHMSTHSGYKPHVCNICSSRFIRRSDLMRHLRIHTGDRPYKCQQCDRFFTQKTSLEKHARIHAKRMGGVACELCGLTLRDPQELVSHLSSAHGDKNWQCETCGKAFSAERYLQQHLKTHSENKQYSCSVCDKRFALRALCVRHEDRAHRNRPEIKCDECGRVFQRRENLTRHKRSHSGVKEFRCPVCDMGFTEKGSVRRHMMSRHENLRPHQCHVCEKTFSRKSLLNRHKEKHHGIKWLTRRKLAQPRPATETGDAVLETGDAVLETALAGDFKLEETTEVAFV